MRYRNLILTIALSFSFITIGAPFDSTYAPQNSPIIFLKNANIYDGEGNELLGYDLLVKNGQIQAIGKNLVLNETGKVLSYDLTNQWVTPCLLYTSPSPRDS